MKKQIITFGTLGDNLWRVGLDEEGGVTLDDYAEAWGKYVRAREEAKHRTVTIQMVNRY